MFLDTILAFFNTLAKWTEDISAESFNVENIAWAYVPVKYFFLMQAVHCIHDINENF
jgi:hypothetical protein